MSAIVVDGGYELNGRIRINGAKNSALPIIAASMMCSTPSYISNCPKLTDVEAAIKILSYLGCKSTFQDKVIFVDSSVITQNKIPDWLMREMRSSIVFLGAIISRCREAVISFPGGCELGARPIDLHLESMKQLGVDIEEDHGYLFCSAINGLHGAKISLSFPSVGATENILLAASMAKGQTTINNAAREPEIIDLANYLNACGARIYGAGEGTITVEGVDRLNGCAYSIMPDRIETATYLCSGAVTGGDVILSGARENDIASLIPILQKCGCEFGKENDSIRMFRKTKLKDLGTVRTMPYPGVPTDAQAPLMAVSCYSEGTSVFIENIFESRFKHVGELIRMGAKIKTEGRMAVVEGIDRLHSANVTAMDLRGGASLIIAALGADGVSSISGINHIDRGYEQIETSLSLLGAHIKRV